MKQVELGYCKPDMNDPTNINRLVLSIRAESYRRYFKRSFRMIFVILSQRHVKMWAIDC